MKNPFGESEKKVLQPPATGVVIFGGTGDLAKRKLLPALYNLAYDGYLPPSFFILGASRSKLSDEEFRAAIYEGMNKFSRRPLKDEVWNEFSKRIHYQPVAFTDAADFKVLKNRLDALSQGQGQDLNYLYYLATDPGFFGPIATNLKSAGLVEDLNAQKATRLVVEKPFGKDLQSSIELNDILRQSFAEQQIFRIDHYLGKETVQNILVFRFANGMFEPLWNHKYIDHIQISVCESVGVESRAGYFDSSGILRDIVQNHLLQVLSLLCIEPPISLTADSIRDEKVKVLKSIRRYTAQDVAKSTVRAQYKSGHIDGLAVPGYLEEKGVPASSTTDTFVALDLRIDNWRWAGVPIYVRAGKRLAKRISEITVYFKNAPDALFRGQDECSIEQNVLAIQIQPNEGISLKISSKPPGPKIRVSPVVMDFNYGKSFGVALPEAYERLLLDAMKGEATLFTRNDEIEQAWDLLEPIFKAWSAGADQVPVYNYEAGTWGPQAAANLLKPLNHRWRRL